jgi:hypothetical protein
MVPIAAATVTKTKKLTIRKKAAKVSPPTAQLQQKSNHMA